MPAHRSALVIVLGACLVGCASPDLPTARHAIVPVPVNDLSARQVGDTVILNFTLPATSTDLLPLGDMPSVEIYRNSPQAAATVPKAGAKKKSTPPADTIPSETIGQYQKNGRIEFPDKLDASELASESGTDLVYTVRTRVSRAQASADSNAVTVRVYPAPAPVQDLRATLTETALVLGWSAAQEESGASAGKAAGFHIYRAQVDPTTTTAAAEPNPSEAKLIAPPELLAQTTETQYRDTTFQFGNTYFYWVRRAMQFGAANVESADSAPAVLAARDIFPPAAPQGVEAVVEPTANGTPASIELTWTISSEPDLAGYNVYRSEQANAPGQKLNSDFLLVPTFRDMSVVPGKSYFYRVGAVDQSGNQSSLSPAVEAQAPGP